MKNSPGVGTSYVGHVLHTFPTSTGNETDLTCDCRFLKTIVTMLSAGHVIWIIIALVCALIYCMINDDKATEIKQKSYRTNKYDLEAAGDDNQSERKEKKAVTFQEPNSPSSSSSLPSSIPQQERQSESSSSSSNIPQPGPILVHANIESDTGPTEEDKVAEKWTRDDSEQKDPTSTNDPNVPTTHCSGQGRDGISESAV